MDVGGRDGMDCVCVLEERSQALVCDMDGMGNMR